MFQMRCCGTVDMAAQQNAVLQSVVLDDLWLSYPVLLFQLVYESVAEVYAGVCGERECFPEYIGKLVGEWLVRSRFERVGLFLGDGFGQLSDLLGKHGHACEFAVANRMFRVPNLYEFLSFLDGHGG